MAGKTIGHDSVTKGWEGVERGGSSGGGGSGAAECGSRGREEGGGGARSGRGDRGAKVLYRKLEMVISVNPGSLLF